ncbi:MAG: hypothetical protein ACJA1L_000091 [Paracoccaceae bacterium]|jgi:hypothetical protein
MGEQGLEAVAALASADVALITQLHPHHFDALGEPKQVHVEMKRSDENAYHTIGARS